MHAAPVSPTPARQRPVIEVDVVMRREPVQGAMARWQPWRWVLADVMLHAAPDEAALLEPDEAHAPQAVEPIAAGSAAEGSEHWLHPRFRVELFRDDAEGYMLNLESPTPCFWVMWRAEGDAAADGEPMAVPLIVTLSYHDAGRWLDAQERVDQVPAPPEVVDWLRAFVDVSYVPEPKKRKRPESFRSLTDRFDQPVRVSTDKRRGGPQGH